MRPNRSSRTPEFARQIAKEFGRRLKRLRHDRRIAQDAFARTLGVSRTTASNIERGTQRLFLDQVYRAADILNVSIEALLPDHRHVARELVIHVAADEALSPVEARQVAEVVRELGASRLGKRQQPLRTGEPK